MPLFTYTARTASGEDITGTLTAASKRDMLNALAEQSLFPIRVEAMSVRRMPWQRKRRIKPAVIASTLTQLADLLQNSVPVLKAIDVLARQAVNPEMTEILTTLRDRVAEGASLDIAMAEHPRVFGELTVSMVRAGSEGAFLEDALKRTADFLDLQEELKGRLVGAMFYPAFLGTLGAAITIGLVVFLVPRFAELFARLEESGGLPLATTILLTISDLLRNWGLLIAGGLVALVYWLRKVVQSPRGREQMDRLKIRVPIFGPIFLGTAVARFCRVLGTLLQNGVPLLRSLEISSESTGNSVLAAAILRSAENVSSGDSLSKPLATSGMFPRSVMAMITVAEESNNLDKVLVNIADSLDKKTGRQLDMMVRMVEPVMLLTIGLVIGFVAVAIFLPMFDMSRAVG